MKVKLYIVILIYLVFVVTATGQNDSISIQMTGVDTVNLHVIDTLPSRSIDSMQVIDTIRQDSLGVSNQIGPTSISVALSKDSLDAPVDYGARDSSRFDNVARIFHLYGEAYVKYQDYSITADYITVSMDDNVAVAYARIDSVTGIASGLPQFKDAENDFTAKKMRFNFKSKKGLIYEAVTQEDDIYIHGGRTKFFAEDAKQKREDDIIYNKDALFTTCDHEVPHYGIRSNKQKIIPGKLIIVGPSHVEIGGISTPLWLPFGFFPITSSKRHGLLFPKDYEYSPNYGYGFNNIGYFIPFGDYANLSATFDIYTRGTYRVHLNSAYKKKYKYNGSLSFNYASLKDEVATTATFVRNTSWGLNWSHSQDSKAHPTQSFSGSVNLQSGNYQVVNRNDFNSVTNNTISSNLRYSRTFPGSPFSLNASMNHSQSSQTRLVTATLPRLEVQMARIYPFKRKIAAGGKKWYENITLNYDIEAQNRIRAADTTIFQKSTIDNMQYALQHNASSGLNLKVAKFFNVTPNIRYTETYNFKSIRNEYDSTLIIKDVIDDEGGIVQDTIMGAVNEVTRQDFSSYRDLNMGVSVSTTIFGTVQFKKGKLRGIRHVITPTISYNFHPDISDEEKFRTVFDASNVPDELGIDDFEYNILSRSPFGTPSSTGKSQTLNYSFQNILEAKVYSKKDSTTKKLKFFESFNLSGNYNFEADSLKFSPMTLSAVTRLFGGVTTINYGATYDFYELKNGVRVNTFERSATGRLLRFDRAAIRINSIMRLSQFVDLFGKREDKNRFIDLFSQFSIRHNFNLKFDDDGDGIVTEVATNSLSTSGSVKLSPKWTIRFSQIGYDFNDKGITYPDLAFTRDLHCWEMGISTQPIRGTFAFYIQVKPGSLDFLSLPFDRNIQDVGNPIF